MGTNYGQMDQGMKVTGGMIKQMAMESLFMQTGTFTRVNGSMTKHMVKELILMQMEHITMANG